MNLVLREHDRLNTKSQTELSSAVCYFAQIYYMFCQYAFTRGALIKLNSFMVLAWKRREKTQCSYWGNWETICRSQCRTWGSGFKINAVQGIKGEVSAFPC